MWWVIFGPEEDFDPVGGRFLVWHPRGHGAYRAGRRPSDRQEEEYEHGDQQQRVPGDLPEHGLHAGERGVAIPEGDGLRTVWRDGDQVRDDPVRRIPDEERQQQVGRHPAQQVVEDPARHPLGDRDQRVDHADVPQVEVFADTSHGEILRNTSVTMWSPNCVSRGSS